MNLFKQFATNSNLEREGINYEIGKTDDGKPIVFKIARSGGNNLNFAKTLKRKTDPYRRQIQLETIDEELLGNIMREVYAESVILGWENVQDEQGNEIEYSVPACVKLMKQLPDLYHELLQISENVALYRANAIEADAKN